MNTPPHQRTGTVRKWIGNIGMILDDETSEPLFVHFTGIVPAPGRRYRELAPGQRVSFHVMPSPKGPIATGVRVIA
jgi:cold shock CspA family protein